MGAKRSSRKTRNADSLRETQIYRDYHKAFTQSTGLPLRLRDATQVGVALKFGKGSSSFCTLMAETDVSCHACLAMQKQISHRAEIQSKSLKCFAGLCETAVPVRVGENLVAWLETGQVLIDSPTKSRFSRLAKTLLRWGTHVDLKRAEEAYFNTRVISRSQYESAVHLLQIFAGHLAEVGQKIAFKQSVHDLRPRL